MSTTTTFIIVSIEMFKAVLILALVTFAVEAKPKIHRKTPRFDGRIVGGQNAYISDYPHQISLQFLNSHDCGGSIVSVKKILTASHCTEERYTYQLSVRYGTTYHDDGPVVNVKTIKMHDYYNPSTADNDVAVLTLENPVLLYPYSNADIIELATRSSTILPQVGREAVVTGWGRLWNGGPIPYQLQKVTVYEISREDCEDKYAQVNMGISDTMICFADENRDSCSGDSGGPLVSGGKQIGVVSWGLGCADSRYPGVYADVSVLRGFIDSQVQA